MTLGRTVLGAAMPPQCPVTGDIVERQGVLAPAGWAALHFIEEPFCARCGIPFKADYGEGIECASCIASPPVFDQARAVLSYDEGARKVVSGFKFKDRLETADMLGAWMARSGRDILSSETFLAPVPLHWRRLLARRFNQSALLARALGDAASLEVVVDGLERIRSTPPQKEITSHEERRRNVAGAFAVAEKYRARFQDAHIVLVDDVLTSGATVSACARALKKAGAARIDVLVLARVVKGGVGAI